MHVPDFKTLLDRVIAFVKENAAYIFGLSIVGSLVAIGPLAITMILMAAVPSLALILGILAFAASIFLLFAMVVTQIAVTKSSFTGKGEPIMDALKKAFADRQLFWRFLGGAILAGILIVVGFFLLVIPGIYVSVPLALWPYVMVKERLGPVDSIKRCFALAKGFWWTMFSRFVWMGVLIAVVQLLLNVITSGLLSAANPSSFPVILAIMGMVGWLVSAIILIPLQLVFGRYVYEHVLAAKTADANASQKLTGAEIWMLVAAIVIAIILNSIGAQFSPKTKMLGNGNITADDFEEMMRDLR